RGEGAFLDGQRLLTDVPERRSHDGKLELLGIESADPRWIRDAADELAEAAHRIRALGTIAVTLCQVAAARMDGMITLRRSRAVDTAAGQLIVREAGGCVAFLGYDDPLGAPLDAEPRAPIIAARTPGALRELLRVPLQ
ncbi:MAG: monophosphatase, partial [Solirubrobacteraceae bacterium]|nr:monophosphatase [Solirubrobacteraceae bacterium]